MQIYYNTKCALIGLPVQNTRRSTVKWGLRVLGGLQPRLSSAQKHWYSSYNPSLRSPCGAVVISTSLCRWGWQFKPCSGDIFLNADILYKSAWLGRSLVLMCLLQSMTVKRDLFIYNHDPSNRVCHVWKVWNMGLPGLWSESVCNVCHRGYRRSQRIYILLMSSMDGELGSGT